MYQYTVNDKLRLAGFSIHSGPCIAFKTNTDFPRIAADGSGFINSQLNSKEVGITVGGGLKFSYVHVGMRYDVGLTSVIKRTDAKNSVLSVVADIGL